MKKIITLIIASIIAISMLIIPKKNIVKAEEITQSIQFIYKNTLTTQDISYLEQIPQNTIGSASNTEQYFTTTYTTETEITYQFGITQIYYRGLQQWDERTIIIQVTRQELSEQGQGIQFFYIMYKYTTNNYNTLTIDYNIPNITAEEFYSLEWNIENNNIFNLQVFQNLKNIIWKANTIYKLDTPTINLNFQTITWQAIENAEYYNIFRNGNLIGQTESTQWVTITNGTYTIQACTNNSEIVNSNISNSVIQDRYNDMIGNGANWYTFMSAWIDTTIHLLKSMLNYEIWGINFFALLQLVITIVLTWIIIKFIIGL